MINETEPEMQLLECCDGRRNSHLAYWPTCSSQVNNDLAEF